MRQKLKLDHGLLLQNLLERYHAKYSPRAGWQPIRCISPSHGDRNKSASVNLVKGAYRCHACEIVGDAIKVIRTIENLGFMDALNALGGANGNGRVAGVDGQARLMEPPHKVWF